MSKSYWFDNDCLDDDHINDFAGVVSAYSGRQNTNRLIPKFEGKGYPTAEEDELDEMLDEPLGWKPEPEVKRPLNAYLGRLGFPDAKPCDHIAKPRTWQQAFGTGSMFAETTPSKPADDEPEVRRVTASIEITYFGTKAEAIEWADNHTVYDMLDTRGVSISGPDVA